jgi:hypothetical protein
MKRLDELTVQDLRETPVWRYEGGAGRDALVEPSSRAALSQADDEIFLAATDFTLADASPHFGFCFPADDSSVDYLQPVIVSAAAPVRFWFDEPVAPDVLSRQWIALGRNPENVFPVDFRCLVPVDGRIVRGRIERIESVSNGIAPPPPTRKDAAGRPPESPGPEPVAVEGERVLTARPRESRDKGAGGGGKRTSRRRKVEMPVKFSQGPLEGTGVTGDVSRRGMFVRSKEIPGPGPMLRLTVKLPGGRELVLKGRVVRKAGPSLHSSAAPGFGLRLAEEWPEYERLFPKRRDTPE